ncbi:hypothetical protein [uncultured Bartonella sp.]|nr:hypothetical protein [uncultured Bartonella sp.]
MARRNILNRYEKKIATNETGINRFIHPHFLFTGTKRLFLLFF